MPAGVADPEGAWGLTSRLRLLRAANKSGSEAIHSTGLHGVLTLVSGWRATKIVRFPVWVRCTLVQKFFMGSSSCSFIFILFGTRFALCPRWSIIRFSFVCSRVGCRVVPAVARYFHPFLVSVGRRSPRLSRGLVAGFCTQGAGAHCSTLDSRRVQFLGRLKPMTSESFGDAHSAVAGVVSPSTSSSKNWHSFLWRNPSHILSFFRISMKTRLTNL